MKFIFQKETNMASTAEIGGSTETRQPETEVDGREHFSQSTSEQGIRQRAYEIYLKRAGQSGSELEDWLQAERELTPSESRLPLHGETEQV